MKYIDAEKLIAELRRQIEEDKNNITEDTKPYYGARQQVRSKFLALITSLQQEQPMPDSTKLIELWHEDKEKLKEKDFRNDPWRLAYNAFLCGFGRGIAVNKQEQPEVECEDLEEAAEQYAIPFNDTTYGVEYSFKGFKAGAEWCAEHFRDITKMVSEGLEEAAMQYLDNHKPLTRYNWGDLMDAFKAGAEWGAEHVKR